MRVLLIGGSGFIGSNLAESFINIGIKVIVLDRKEGNYENISSIKEKIKIYKGHYNDKEILENIFENNDISIVVNLVTTVLPNTTLDNLNNCINENITANITLFRVMKNYNVRKIIYFSSGGTVYGNNGKSINTELDLIKPINYYGWIKSSVENLVMVESNLSNIEYLIIRPSNPYGKNQNIYGNQGLIAILFGKILKNESIEIWGDGNIVRDYIYIEDMCRAVVNIIKSNKWNEIYNIGSGKGFTINEVINNIEEITNKKINKIYKEKRNVDIIENILDIEKIRSIIKFDDILSLKEGLAKTWEILKEEYFYEIK